MLLLCTCKTVDKVIILCVCVLSHAQLFATSWTIACQVPPSRGFSRQEYWSALPFPSSGDLHNPGIEPASPVFPALAGRFFTARTTWEAQEYWSEMPYPPPEDLSNPGI